MSLLQRRSRSRGPTRELTQHQKAVHECAEQRKKPRQQVCQVLVDALQGAPLRHVPGDERQHRLGACGDC